jgi:hypothetical protein
VRHRFVWRYLVGFVHPASGRTLFHLATSVSIPLFEIELDHFAAAVGASPEKQIVLVLDRAGWHTSLRLRVPEHVHLHFLPPYSPELQPAEHLLAADERGARQPPLRHDRATRRGPIRPLPRSAGAAPSHPLDHLLPLVAQAAPQTSRTQAKVV